MKIIKYGFGNLKMVDMLKIKNLLIIFTTFILGSCHSQEFESLVGNVYSFNGKCEKSKESYINGFRIEEINKDSSYVRFSFDKEIFIGISMLYDETLKQYYSINEIPIHYKKLKKNKIILEIKSNNSILLSFKNSSQKIENIIFKFKHNTPIIKEHIRNPYYAEDGFNLCKN